MANDKEPHDRRWTDRLGEKEFKALAFKKFETVDSLEKAVMGWRDPVTLERQGGLLDLMHQNNRKMANIARTWTVIGGILSGLVVAVGKDYFMKLINMPMINLPTNDPTDHLRPKRGGKVFRMRDPSTGKTMIAKELEVPEAN